MSFGDWEMFKVMLISLRGHEITSVLRQDEVQPVRTTKLVERRGESATSCFAFCCVQISQYSR